MRQSGLLIGLPRLRTGHTEPNESGTSSLDCELSSSDMDQIDRIAEQVGDLRAGVSSLTTKVESFTDLLTHQVTHQLESMKHSQSKQGTRIGDLETWHSITEDREARSKWARGLVQALVTLVAGAALLKSFGLA